MKCSEHTRECLDGTQSFLLTLVSPRRFTDNSLVLSPWSFITEGIYQEKRRAFITASPLVAGKNAASADHAYSEGYDMVEISYAYCQKTIEISWKLREISEKLKPEMCARLFYSSVECIQWVPLNIIPFNRISRFIIIQTWNPKPFPMLSHTFYSRIMSYHIEQFCPHIVIIAHDCACVIRHSTTSGWSFATLHSPSCPISLCKLLG